jgi:nuclear pore complex protein Nup50
MNVQKNTVASIFHTSVSNQSPLNHAPYTAQNSENKTKDHNPCIYFQDTQSDESSSGAVVARAYLFRLKNEEAATKLSTAIKDSAPSD